MFTGYILICLCQKKTVILQTKACNNTSQTMKIILYIPILYLLAATILSGCTKNDTAEVVSRMAKQHPQTMIQDVYKSFYQDRFGSGHAIGDTAAVREYLTYELAVAAADTVTNPYYEPVGAQGRYVRVYLRCVNEGLLTEEKLLEAFVRSALPSEQPEQSWSDEWAQIEKVARQCGIPCTDEENRQLQQAAQGNHAVHHSEAYRNANHPHYRIVGRTIFESEIKPLIER